MSLDFKRRVTGLQEKMAEEGLDVVVFWKCSNNVFIASEGSPILSLDEIFSEQSQKTHIKGVRVLNRIGRVRKRSEILQATRARCSAIRRELDKPYPGRNRETNHAGQD
jgi:hypothetical protein